MIKVLICDDDEVFLARLRIQVEKALSDSGVNAMVRSYTTWEEIGEAALASCDIAFLDVDFAQKQYTGLDVAKKLRSLRRDAIIIFVTNYIEYAPDGYEVQAFRYVLKSAVSHKLAGYLQLAVAQLQKSRETMKIRVDGEYIDILLRDILFFEAQQHTVLIHMQRDKNGKYAQQYEFYSSLSNLEKEMEAQGFLRIHRSYLVNMRHIKRYQCHEVTLSDGTVLNSSEKNYAQQKKKYLLWKGR